MSLNVDYTKTVLTYQYNGYGDIFAKLGGLRAAIMPIVGLFTPFTAFYFLFTLA